MSDRSSESSCEWVVLNEDEEELNLNVNEQSLNSELSYDAVCYAVSDSIRSSLTNEEIEWSYEQLKNYVSSHRPFIQEVVSRDFDDSENEDSNAEDEVVNKCVSTSDIEEDYTNAVSISKNHTYKHNRNDKLNFFLNFTLALVLASAIGLGVGHFLGWSHKCFRNTLVSHKSTQNAAELSHSVIIKQKNENNDFFKEETKVALPLENLLNSVACSGLKGKDDPVHSDISGASVNSNFAVESGISETSMFVTSDVLELETQEEILQNNFSNPYVLNITPESDDVTKIDWIELSNLKVAAKKIQGLKEASSDNMNINSLSENEVNNIELEFIPRNAINEEISDGNGKNFNSKISFSVTEDDNFLFESKLNNNNFEFLKEYFSEKTISDRENIFIKQLKNDLNEVVQSLATLTLARLSDIDEKYLTLVEESGSIIRLFGDFQTLINVRVTDLDNFINSKDYRDISKHSLKYLQKMIYTVVDSVDYLLKITFKTLSKDERRINVQKFSSNISKVIFNFNKKWEKNNRLWFESLEKSKTKKFRERYFEKVKEDKFWKNRAHFEKHMKKNKYRNLMKS